MHATTSAAQAAPTFAQYAARRGVVSDRVKAFQAELALARDIQQIRAAHDALWAGQR